MAGGPFQPVSEFPVDAGLVFEGVHEGDGGYDATVIGLGVADATTLTADGTWRLVFEMPPALPTGTAKLRIISFGDAETGVLKVNPKWASVAAGEDPSVVTLNAEGTSTITWTTGSDDRAIETKITLDADTVTAGELIFMDLVFEDTDTTIAVDTVHLVSIIFE